MSIKQDEKAELAPYVHTPATGKNCIVMGYEGGVEFVPPQVTGIIAYSDQRNRDCLYNPNWYIAEQDWYAWLQMQP